MVVVCRMKSPLVASLVVVALAALPSLVSAHGHCVDSLPIFGSAQPSNRPPPYVITAAPTRVNGGDTVKVVISGGEPIHSLYLQAHSGAGPLGEFVAPSGQGCRAGVFGCPAGQKNAFSYNSRRGANATEVEWKAPQINAKVVFRASIVKSFSEFWVGVESDPITVGTVAV